MEDTASQMTKVISPENKTYCSGGNNVKHIVFMTPETQKPEKHLQHKCNISVPISRSLSVKSSCKQFVSKKGGDLCNERYS